MIIKPVEFKLQIKNDESRSGGVHVSDIVRDIGLQMGYLAPQYATSEMDAEKVSLGLAWEDHVFVNHHPEVIYHPGEIVRGGLPGTVDGISWVENGGGSQAKIHECKLTWKSMNKARDLQGEWMWLAQTMTYCHHWDTNLAQYHIYWINGNYRFGDPEGGPQYRLYDLEFTTRELKDHWDMINRRGREKFGL